MELIPGKLYQTKKAISWGKRPFITLKGTPVLIVKVESEIVVSEIVVRESKHVHMLVDGVYKYFWVRNDKHAEEYFRPCN